jgi:hypothetical protein
MGKHKTHTEFICGNLPLKTYKDGNIDADLKET